MKGSKLYSPGLLAAMGILFLSGCSDLVLEPQDYSPNASFIASNGDLPSMTATGLPIRELSVLRAPGPDGVLGTDDDILTAQWPELFWGLPSPPGDLWHALGVDLAPENGSVAMAIRNGFCLGAHKASPRNNFDGSIRIRFVDPATGEPTTAGHVAVEMWDPPAYLRAYDADGQIIVTYGLPWGGPSGFLVVETPGIAYVDVWGDYWCVGNRIRYALETAGEAQPPVADAGADQVVEATSPDGAVVTLDGSASGADDPAEIVSWQWLDQSGGALAEGETAEVLLSLGTHVITLRVTDTNGLTADDQVVITVEDTTPPGVLVSVTPDLIWPPNHSYRVVTIQLDVADAASVGEDLVVVAEAVSNEADNARGVGDGNTTGDIRVTRADGTILLSSNGSPVVGFDPRTDQLEVRAERNARGSGRTYTIRVTVSDPSGNVGTGIAEVHIPANLSGTR